MARPVEQLDASNSLLDSLLKLIPHEVMIIDEDEWVVVMNNVFEFMLSSGGEEIFSTRDYTISHSTNRSHVKKCGHSHYCEDCKVRSAAREVLLSNEIRSTAVQLQFPAYGDLFQIVFHLKINPVVINGKRAAVVGIENLEYVAAGDNSTSSCGLRDMIGQNALMVALFDTIKEVAPINVPVLIQGETGTGKELAASAVHRYSTRASSKFVPVNCAALPHGLLESELFGHMKGSFTGAINDKKGRFELAHGGTIFLDEIGDMSPELQAKLLRVLQEGYIERLGSVETVKVDVRLVSATNKELEKEVAAGRFRSDLFYRLCVVPIILPPLRERIDDLPLLTEAFVENFAEQLGKRRVRLAPDTLSILMRHHWPGNVRELKNAIYFACIRCSNGVISPEHLPPSVNRSAKGTDRKIRNKQKLDAARVFHALNELRGNKIKAAKMLGVSRSTLYRFLDNNLGEGMG
jgi:transcriptional regulator with PAS, ATPase and Fis domain